MLICSTSQKLTGDIRMNSFGRGCEALSSFFSAYSKSKPKFKPTVDYVLQRANNGPAKGS